MKTEEALKWLDELEARARTFRNENHYYRNEADAAQWIADAESALRAILPAGHALLSVWSRVIEDARNARIRPTFDAHFEQLVGALRSARSQLSAGRISSLIAGVQAEDASDLLSQAETLRAAGHLAAATVIAGGALEMHLSHLCRRSNLSGWKGDGSIEKYNNAIGEARNAGDEVYSATEGKQVTAWGGTRNDAAHSPGTFNGTSDDVRRMIEGIRDFLARTER